MAFPGRNYAPPGVYTQTFFDNPVAGGIDTLKIPVFVGEGNEELTQINLELVRGSSSVADQRIVKEDMTGRAVVGISATGVVSLGDYDGTLKRIQVRNYPIVTGDGTGTTTINRSDVTVLVNGTPVIVLAVDGARGILELSSPMKTTDTIQVTYFFNRTDTYLTEDVSAQVTALQATVRGVTGIGDETSADPTTPFTVLDFHGDILNTQGQVVVPANNVLILGVDGTTYTVTIPPRPDYTMPQVASVLNASALGTLVASAFINNFGKNALLLVASQDLSIGNGSANALLGLVAGTVSTRRKTFYTYQGPIVDGSNGGVTTTDPADVVVKVNGVQVVPTSVDGANRAVTLPYAPAAGSTVTITYFFNTWQDTFDYLAHLNVTSVLQCGDVPNSSSYIQGADFILKNDRIHWGTSVLVEAGIHTPTTEAFNENQVTTLLIDNKTFLSPATATVNTSTGVSVASQTEFQLAFAPTLGNGRDTELGQSLFQTVANDRIDLPVNRPDVVLAYWGFSVNDALNRGPVDVIKVDGSVITLADKVPVGATVYATHWYNVLTDNVYTLQAEIAGVSGVGTYTVFDQGNNAVFGPKFDIGSKGAALNGVAINWPSGSELASDLRFESVSGSAFTGPVAEIVSVQFAAREATPAKYTVPGAGDYEFVNNQSDRTNIWVDGSVLSNNGAGGAGLDLANPSGHDAGFFASLVGNEISYTGGATATVGQAYDVDVNEFLTIQIDGVVTNTTIEAAPNVDAQHFVTAINESVAGHQSTTGALSGASDITLNAVVRSGIDNFYNGWVVVGGNGGAAAGESFTIASYVGSTGVATIDGAWAATPLNAEPYYIYNPDHLTTLKAATSFNGPVTLDLGKHDNLRFDYTGTTAASSTLTAVLGAGPFATAALLAAEVETQINAAITAALGGTPALAGLYVFVTADPEARLTFSIQLPGVDSAGVLTFIDGATVAIDFAVLAGIDTGATNASGQAKLLQGPIARLYTPATAVTTLLHDRVVLRDRILPGLGGSMSPASFEAQQDLVVGNGSGNTKTGLAARAYGVGGSTATVSPASLAGRIGFLGGQGATMQPSVLFYDGTGANTANNVLAFTLDGVPVSVSFTASTAGTATDVGPIATAGSVLGQIVAQMAALPGTPFGNAANIRDTLMLVRQEGAGLRITSNLSSVSSSVIIGAGSANSILGFAEGDTATRSLVSARKMAAALNSNRHATYTTWMHDFNAFTANYFATDALAWIQVDGASREYLYLQSNTLGSGSSIQWKTSTVASIQTDDVLFPTTGLTVPNLDSASGEGALDGFFVTSNIPTGSGSANDSILNDGTGADGIVGQTYRDAVTGLTFTILPRNFQDSPLGPWLSYPTGGTATFRINVSNTFVTDANIPHNALNGVELTVSNTLGITAGDTALVSTFERGGNEPSIGDIYNVSYSYLKDDFGTALYTKVSAIEAAYGSISPDNPATLASVLAITNGALLVGVHQVQKAADSSQASISAYRAAIDALEGFMPGHTQPDIITLLRGDSIDLYQYLKRSVVKMSSIRYRAERTAVLGFSGGTEPRDAQAKAQLLADPRMRVVYPDIAVIDITDELSNTKQYLMDGTFLASALVGSVVSPNLDVATPWTGRNLVGITQLGRILDAVEANQTAIRGVTVLVDRPPYVRVRQGFTTDMSNILTKLPTITLIADEVQKQARNVLENFIGIKYVPGVLSQIEGRLAMLLKSLVAAQIIAQYTGVKASPSPDDPTTAEVEAYYAPVFPLLYILISFNLRSNL